ncbi:MAG: hypothetical protein ACOCZD_00725 [Haloferacaceae archaeon]
MDPDRLETVLAREFEAPDAERRVVVRQARDLADSGKPETDRGCALTGDELVGHLHDAPAGSTLVERWNWWLGALEIAYGGYDEFRIRVVDE